MPSKITGQCPQYHPRNLQRAAADPRAQRTKLTLLLTSLTSPPVVVTMSGLAFLFGVLDVLEHRPKEQVHIISGTGEIKSLDAVKRQVCLGNFSDISIRHARTNSYWAAEETRSLSNAPFCFHNIPKRVLNKIIGQTHQTQGQAAMFFSGNFRTPSGTNLPIASPGPELMEFRMNYSPQPSQTAKDK